MTTHGFTIDGRWFVDPQGRHTLLRGVNLAGTSKLPAVPPSATHLGVDFDGWREVCFIGRPAPLDELDRHLDRLVHWGFNVVRLLTTWEAIEHAGPGCYDDAYLDYLAEVVRRAGRRGLLVFVDAHQDVWSRFTGGDGAPYWSFEWAGLHPERFVAADAVALDSVDWSWGYQRAPVATMFTLLFAGDVFCPSRAGVQERLQAAFCGAMTQLAARLSGLDNVLGYDVFNEPSPGYLGRRDLAAADGLLTRPHGPARFSPLEYLAAADGVTVERAATVLNAAGVSIWDDGCPWRAAGVWDLGPDGRPVLVDPEHFATVDGHDVAVFADHMAPFVRRVGAAIRDAHPGAVLFVEGSPWDAQVGWEDDDLLVVNARHWYDVGLLYSRRFDVDRYDALLAAEPLVGVEAVADHYAEQIAGYVADNDRLFGARPLLLGEFGLPYDLNDGEAYRTGDYHAHEAVNEAHYRAFDRFLVHSTQWNYTPDSTHRHGDGWNGEDLSIFSPDDIAPAAAADDLDAGGRGTRGFCRPHLLRAAGVPLSQCFDPDAGRFELVVRSNQLVAATAPTENYVPRLHYPNGVTVEASTGEAHWDQETQRITWHHTGDAVVHLTVTRPDATK